MKGLCYLGFLLYSECSSTLDLKKQCTGCYITVHSLVLLMLKQINMQRKKPVVNIYTVCNPKPAIIRHKNKQNKSKKYINQRIQKLLKMLNEYKLAFIISLSLFLYHNCTPSPTFIFINSPVYLMFSFES